MRLKSVCKFIMIDVLAVLASVIVGLMIGVGVAGAEDGNHGNGSEHKYATPYGWYEHDHGDEMDHGVMIGAHPAGYGAYEHRGRDGGHNEVGGSYGGTAATPEPATVVLIGFGLLTIAYVIRSRSGRAGRDRDRTVMIPVTVDAGIDSIGEGGAAGGRNIRGVKT